MNCKKCGHLLNESDVVCSNCGELVNREAQTSNVETMSNADLITNNIGEENVAPANSFAPNVDNAPVVNPAVAPTINPATISVNPTPVAPTPTPVAPTPEVIPANPNVAQTPEVIPATPVQQVPVTPVVQEAPAMQSAPTAPEVTPTSNVTPTPTPAPVEPAPKKENNTVFIIVVVVLVLVICALVYFMFIKKSTTTPATTTTTTLATKSTTTTKQVATPTSNDSTVGNYKIIVPAGYTIKSNVDEVLTLINNTDRVGISLSPRGFSYATAVASKESLGVELSQMGIVIDKYGEETIAGLPYLNYEATVSGNKTYFAFTELSSTMLMEVTIVNAGSKTKEQVFTTVSNMIISSSPNAQGFAASEETPSCKTNKLINEAIFAE